MKCAVHGVVITGLEGDMIVQYSENTVLVTERLRKCIHE